MAKDETEIGITGLPIPKKKRSPAKQHEFEKERRKNIGTNVGGEKYKKDVTPGYSRRSMREEVLSYLLDEGFASDEKSAEAIMGAMSEEWRQSIMEGPGGMMMSAASQGRGRIVKTQPEPGPRPSQSGSAMGRKPVDRSRLQPPVGATVTRYDSGGKPYTHIQK